MRIKLVTGFLISFFVLTGCSSQHPNVNPMGKVKHIVVEQTQKARKNGFLVVKAEVKNTSKRNKMINYRFQWLDDQGFPVGTEEVWKSKLIYGKQDTFITDVAPSLQATDFRIEIQEP